MYTTREYTRLAGIRCEDVTITPNKEFKAFEGDYIVTCYANIKNTETDEVIILKPGDRIKGIGNVVKKNHTIEEMNQIHEKFIDDSIKEAMQKPKPRRKRKVTDGI